MTSKLRPPNFQLSTNKSGNSSYATNNNNNNSHDDGDGIHLVSLSSYTNQCQKQMALVASKKSIDDSYNNNNSDNENSTLDNEEVIYIGDNSNNHSNNNNNSGKDRGSNNEPSMEQCIILLESHLSAFQTSCCQNDKKLRKRKKRKRKRNESVSILHHEEGDDEEEPEDEEEEEEDEVPPQLLRLARFFHYRWVPIKRALLRPIQQQQTDDDDDTVVEVGIKYRLRLAKACYKHGLVAPAEYEMLLASLNKNKSNGNNNDYGGGKSNSSNHNGNEQSDEETLMEKVRLALLRLPTDITTSTTIASSSSSISWRHVKEMILECCRYLEKNGVTANTFFPSSKQQQQQQLDISIVVDWALTSWTALILSSEGMGSSCCWESNNNDQITKIEKEFATILSNRQSHTVSSNSNNINDRNPFQLFATAVSHRINEILSYTNLKQMSGVHLLSMARLLATFHSSNDAEEHILASVLSCSSFAKGKEGGGSGGMDCLDSLSRLLAIYCCSISIGANSSGVGGGDASEDSLMGKAVGRTTAADLETRFYQKLNDKDFVERVLCSPCLSKEGQPSATQRDTVVSRAKSFLGVLISATAHLIKCGGTS